MTRSTDHNELTDAKLVAYLDGVLEDAERVEMMQSLASSQELQKRLVVLNRGGRDCKTAFAPLLDAAPDERMQKMLAGLIVETKTQKRDFSLADNVVPLPRKRHNIWSNITSLAAAAGIALALFSGGVYTGWQTAETPPLQKTKIGWRQAVAQYISLFNKQTLDGMPIKKAAQDEGLARVSQTLALPLDRPKISISNLTFKGTQILNLKGKPLVQIAYLHNNKTPVALCIIKSKKPSSAQKTETRLGLNIVHWVSGGHGYMLIGKIPQKDLQQMAAPLLAQFS